MRIIQNKLLNKSNFRKRIVSLWQDQKEDESYEFIFEDIETEKMFDDLYKRFMQVTSEAS